MHYTRVPQKCDKDVLIAQEGTITPVIRKSENKHISNPLSILIAKVQIYFLEKYQEIKINSESLSKIAFHQTTEFKF